MEFYGYYGELVGESWGTGRGWLAGGNAGMPHPGEGAGDNFGNFSCPLCECAHSNYNRYRLHIWRHLEDATRGWETLLLRERYQHPGTGRAGAE